MEPFKLGHRKALDGVRGLAILMVYASHTAALPLAGGFFGVDLFFVLSGFLITSILLEEWRETLDISLKAFYARRALRLLPALVLMLAVVTAVSYAFEPPDLARRMGKSALMTFLYGANWFLAFRAYPRADLSHTWSLSVEEQFYLIWPLVLLALLKLRWSKGAMIAFLSAGILASAGLRAWLFGGFGSWERVYYGTDTHADGLLVGALVALITWSGDAPRSPRGVLVLNWAGFAFLIYFLVFLAWGWPADAHLIQGTYLPMNLGAGVLVLSLVCSPWRPLQACFESGPLVWLGRLSYGIYLWHIPAGLLSALLGVPGRWHWAGTLALTLGISSVSFYALERPVLRLKRRFERVGTKAPISP